jgi:nucleoid-associated protein YgaU
VIAKALYHDGTAWEIIFNANKDLLNGKPNFLKPGMKLVIPAVKEETVLLPASSK